MENFLMSVFQISLLCGIIFLIAGIISYKFPAKKINDLYGYRTSTSMRSQERWEFAQKYSAMQMIKSALFMMIISLTGYFFPENDTIHITGGFVILFIAVGYLFITTERELKKRFPES